jgi:carboxylesterase
MLTAIVIVAATAACIVGGDMTYACITHRRLKAWETRVVRAPDGVRQGCREFAIGDGPTALLLIHGFGDSPAVYAKLAPALAMRGYACRAMRLPGSAEPMPTFSTTSLAKWRDAVGHEVVALRAEHQQVWIVGHSLGGAIAIDYGLNHPHTVQGIVLLAPCVQVSGARSPVLSPRAWHRIAELFLRRTDMFENVLPIDARDPDLRSYALLDRFIPRAVHRGLFELTRRNAAGAAAPREPLLMVLPREDKVTDNAAAQRFLAAAGARRKSLVVLENSGHVVPLDLDWPRVVEAIDAFVRDAAACGATPTAHPGGNGP